MKKDPKHKEAPETERVHHRPIYVLRWLNFRALIGAENRGSIGEAATRLKKAPGQVSHFGGKTPIKNIGDEIAAQIEAEWDLPHGWLDYNHESLTHHPESSQKHYLRQSYAERLDPAILRDAYLMSVADRKGQYKLENEPELIARHYSFMASSTRSASDVIAYMSGLPHVQKLIQGDGDNGGSDEGPE